jgi:regulator of cell morphogenesis and NO signaling
MKNNPYPLNTIGQIVAQDFRTAEIFKKAGIDFCCGGNKSIAEACTEKGIEPAVIENKLSELKNQSSGSMDNFNEWELDFLCDYIVNKHHKYMNKTLPELRFYTQKIASVHGNFHPELPEVSDLFTKIADALTEHLRHEENVLFPAIKAALRSAGKEHTEIIHSEISRMTGEHEFAGSSMDRIRVITSNYLVPGDACNTYMVTLRLLEQFEDDLHIHVHLENNILYPKALLINSL